MINHEVCFALLYLNLTIQLLKLLTFEIVYSFI